MPTTRCPCLSGQTYDECCGRFHRRESVAPTAVLLMRSRFSAYAVGDADHLRRTWHPTTCPPDLTLDPEVRWYRLDVQGSSRGDLLDTEGTVTFAAHYRTASGPGSQQEVSRFVRERGTWLYLDGTVSRGFRG